MARRRPDWCIDAVVGEIIRRARGGHVLRRRRGGLPKKAFGKLIVPERKLVIVIGRIEVVRRCVGSRSDGIMEDSEARADRGLLVSERRPGQTDPRIDILPVRAGWKNMVDVRKCAVPKRRIQNRVKRPAGWVRAIVVANTDVQGQMRIDLPTVVNIRVDIDLSEIAGRIVCKWALRTAYPVTWVFLRENIASLGIGIIASVLKRRKTFD